jgi:hypothetical protein
MERECFWPPGIDAKNGGDWMQAGRVRDLLQRFLFSRKLARPERRELPTPLLQ